ncbi:hypothetical protein [Botryobacter ruber]|uniref:hypothetical protein n=1 Tax=Botryobacter ruber TaxID=2171629 RepID=UPI000FEC3556|nr:hypothetical protein [Botryobacter ruber]
MHVSSGTFLSCSVCSATLQFKAVNSFCLVCPNCQALNYRGAQQPNLLHLQLKPVQEDMSLIRIGTTGVVSDMPFEVIGRLQYFLRESYRSHWFLLYSNGSTGWLGDWEGSYSVFSRVEEVRNKFEHPVPGKKVQIQKAEYITERIENGRYVAGEGELGDFYLESDKFLSLYFYTTNAALALANIFISKKVDAFTGYYTSSKALNLQNLRQHHDWV